MNFYNPSCSICRISKQDLLSEDWETDEEKISITKSQLEDAWAKSWNNMAKQFLDGIHFSSPLAADTIRMEIFIKELGFK